MKQDMIVILDLGSTQNTVIARMIRDLGVYSEIHPHDITGQELKALPNVKGIILNGGENRVVDGQAVEVRPEIYQLGLPVISVDYPQSRCAVKYQELPDQEILKTFLFEECKAEANWNMKNFIADQVELVRRQVGDKKVLLALSGGVDSSVVAALLIRAVGQQLVCVHVNHGLMRKNESESVVKVFRDELHANLVYVDASERFLGKLAGVSDPEQKRKIIGRDFVEVFNAEAKKIGGAKWLAQGTIYPDVIESCSVKGPSATIKSHHNVGGLPKEMNLKIVEPLRLLFKDEVRRVGRELKMPQHLLGRHPFPGPGLGIRVLGEVTPEKVDILQQADRIFIDGLRREGLYDKVWQAGTILLPVRSVGVMGDARTYENTVALRAVISTDGMTADWVHLPYEFLAQVSNDIINHVRGVNRVVYDISSKPPATIEWE